MDDYVDTCDRCGEFNSGYDMIMVDCFMMVCEECYSNLEQESDNEQ